MIKNAKKEFLCEAFGQSVRCAFIEKKDACEKILETYVLKESYTVEDSAAFLKELDFEYDAGYGHQSLHGYIWYNDGTWSERYEFEGAENWVYKKMPEITKECK